MPSVGWLLPGLSAVFGGRSIQRCPTGGIVMPVALTNEIAKIAAVDLLLAFKP
jgi:hypothetical protein